MCIAHLRQLYVLQHPTPDAGLSGRGGPQMNKFEQVSNDDPHMSLAGVPRSDVGDLEQGRGGGRAVQ